MSTDYSYAGQFTFDKVKIFAVCPSLSSIHDVDEIVFFDDTGKMYQVNPLKQKKKAA